MAQQETILISIEVDRDKAKKELQENIILIEENKQEIKDLNKAYKDGELSIEQYALEVAGLRQQNKELSATNRELIKELDNEDNSLNQLRSSVAKLTKERNGLNVQTQEGLARFEELTKEIKTQNDQIKELEESTGDYRRSVGNYARANENASKTLGDFQARITFLKKKQEELDITTKDGAKQYRLLGDEIVATQKDLKKLEGTLESTGKESGDFFERFGDFTPSTGIEQLDGALSNVSAKGIPTFIRSMSGVKVAIASTGIGLLVVALGSLVTFFNVNKDASDSFSDTLGGLEAVFRSIVVAIANFGGFIVETFKKAVTQLGKVTKGVEDAFDVDILKTFTDFIVKEFVGRISGLIDLYASLFKVIKSVTNGGEGLEEALDSAGDATEKLVKGFSKEETAKFKKKVEDTTKAVVENTEATFKAGEQISKLNRQYEALIKTSQDYIATLETQIQESTQLSNADNIAFKTREENAVRALQLLVEQAKKEEEIANLRIISIQKQIKVAGEGTVEEARLQGELSEARAEAIKKASESAQAQQDLDEKRFQNLRDLVDLELDTIEQRSDAELLANERILADANSTADQREQAIRRINESNQSTFDESIKAIRELNELQKDSAPLTDEIISNLGNLPVDKQREYLGELNFTENVIQRLIRAQTRLNTETNAQIDRTRENEEAGRQQAFNNQIQAIEQQEALRKGAIEQEVLDEEEKARRIQAIEDEANVKKLEAERIFLEQQRQLRIQNGQQTIDIDNRLAQIETEIVTSKIETEKNLEQQKLNFLSSINEERLNSISSALQAGQALAKKDSVTQKALAVADATINTYKGANQALASAPPPFNFISAGAVITSGLLNVAKIVSTKVDGSATGSTGGGGGASISPSASVSTGQATSGADSAVQSQQNFRQILEDLPTPQVSVTEIEKVQNNKNTVEVISSLG